MQPQPQPPTQQPAQPPRGSGRRQRVGWSRRLSYLLRHDPDAAGLELDPAGWVPERQLLERVPGLTRELLETVLADDDKGRFARDAGRIRARHGHSAGVADAAHTRPSAPPPVLYHGTTEAAAAAIAGVGIQPRTRRFVHLSTGVAAATEVARRRGPAVVLAVDTAAAAAAGVVFHASGNGIWLSGAVPAHCCTRLTDPPAGPPAGPAAAAR